MIVKTNFSHTRVPLLPGLEVVIDGNSKIAAGNGTFANPQPNAFSLPAASVSGAHHCPGSTEACRASCYVKGLAQHTPDVYAAYEWNAVNLDRILDPKSGYVFADSARALGVWIADHCVGGFRWHVSGDVRDEEHARWIETVCGHSQNVRHWIYTRTLDAVRVLSRARNLTVNVSADRDNWHAAKAAAERYGARLCYMATTAGEALIVGERLPDGSVIFPDYPIRGRDMPDPTAHPFWRAADHRTRLMICPADFFGQSESARCGPCDKCLKPSRGSRA